MADWKIAGEPDGAVPIVGEVYQIQDVRKGMFIGEIVSVNNIWADVQRLSGKIKWASTDYQWEQGQYPNEVSIRDTLVYLIPRAAAELPK